MDSVQKETLERVVEWLEAYIDYHIDEPSVLEEGVPTDAQWLSNDLPVLKGMLSERNEIKDSPYLPDEDYEDVTLWGQDLKNALFSAAKFARESVNPNYKYCVTDSGLYDVYLTDDFGTAMECASSKSKYKSGMWRVFSIKETRDGYRCFTECWYNRGEYYEGNRECFLHYDYIAHNAKIHKL